MYSWNTYPLTSLIEINWDFLKTLPADLDLEKRSPIEVAVTEITGCAERALNFMHTGNPAVIKSTVMNPLWIGELSETSVQGLCKGDV
jgi:hypothetical protein